MKKVDLPRFQRMMYLHLNCQCSKTNLCEAEIPEVISIKKKSSDASSFLFVSKSLGLDLPEILIAALHKRRQYLPISSKRKIGVSFLAV